MSKLSAKRLLSFSVPLMALILNINVASADPSDLDAALNDSLQEHKEIVREIKRKPTGEKVESPILKAGKTREEVQINFDFEESDTKSASNYTDISDIVERRN